MVDRVSAEAAAALPGGPGHISCAAPGCTSRALPPPVPMADGHPMAPDGWGEAEIHLDAADGGTNVFVIFLCSKACERAVAANPPNLRGATEPSPPGRLWTPGGPR